jgi:hypothetical protein
MMVKKVNKLGQSCAKLRSSMTCHSQPAYLAFLSKFSCHLQTNWDCLPFTKDVMSSSINKTNWGHLLFTKNWGHLPFVKKIWGCLPFTSKFRSSSIYNKIEFVFLLRKRNKGRLPFIKKLRSSSIHKKYWGRLLLLGLSCLRYWNLSGWGKTKIKLTQSSWSWSLSWAW